MTSIERARKFIQTRGKAIALTIVPLASLAIAASQPARAAQVQVPGFMSGGCSVSSSGALGQPSGFCLDTPIPGFQNGANALKLSGTAQVSASSGAGSLTFEMTGTATGFTPTGALPLSWDFSVGTSQQIGSGSYSLSFNFNSGGFVKNEGGSLNFNSQCGDFTCANVIGTDQFGVDGPIHSYDVLLTISGYFNQGTFLQLNVPTNSIDVNPLATSESPEPASLALGATGLLGLMISRFRRRKV